MGDELPREFRLFTAGVNDTRKGQFLFDEQAARSVMANQANHGVDRMIDLEHLSLDTESKSYDPDARGWCRLEMRGGDLWAVDVRWTEDGARRLTAKTQRYISPAFLTDDESDPPRIIEVFNIALTALPATDQTPALVAANRGNRMKVDHIIARLSARADKLRKLADETPVEGEKPAGKIASVIAAAQSAMDALAALQKAAKSADHDAVFGAIDEAQAAVDAFEDAVYAATGVNKDADKADEMGEPAEATAAEQMSARDRAELIRLKNDENKRKEAARLAAIQAETERKAKEIVKRRELCARLVTDRGFAPSEVWVEGKEGIDAKPAWESMPIDSLEALANVKRVPGNVQAPPLGGPITADFSRADIGEDEVAQVRLRAQTMLDQRVPGAKSVDAVLAAYREHKTQGMASYEKMTGQKGGRPVTDAMTLTSARNGLVKLSFVQPIQEFGAASQRALEQFRLDYNLSLAAQPTTWVEDLGDVLPAGAMKQTMPINFSATQYNEVSGPNAQAKTSLTKEITVRSHEFYAAEEVELKRLARGDFAYVLAWGDQANRMARARILLRGRKIAALLAAAASTEWGKDSQYYPNGFEGSGVYFFSASHKVNPFDASIYRQGTASTATWGNLQGTAAPLSAGALTTEKANFLQHACDPVGTLFNTPIDTILVPMSLAEIARNLLTVQDVILDANASLKGVSNTFGAVKNPHYNSGLNYTTAPDLTGTDSTADYYLASKALIRGSKLPPWAISEGTDEEVRVWDTNSDFYKGSGMIKYESRIEVSYTLMYPHGLRLIKGA